nr:MAG TPA: hypothetical protein [Caudoviricetes sp.]
MAETVYLLDGTMDVVLTEKDVFIVHEKLGVRIVQQGKKVCEATQEILEAFAGDPAQLKASDTETLKQVLEYLGLVEVGLKQFMETTKAPNANNAPNEI